MAELRGCRLNRRLLVSQIEGSPTLHRQPELKTPSVLPLRSPTQCNQYSSTEGFCQMKTYPNLPLIAKVLDIFHILIEHLPNTFIDKRKRRIDDTSDESSNMGHLEPRLASINNQVPLLSTLSIQGSLHVAQTLICGVLLRYYFFFSVPFEYEVTVWAGPVKERRQLKHGIGKAKDVIMGTSQISPFCMVPIVTSFASTAIYTLVTVAYFALV